MGRWWEAAVGSGNRSEAGFTLIELLITIVILGILGTVVVFSVRGATPNAQATSCEATARTYKTAIEAWYALDPADRVDTNSDGNPSGPDLEANSFIRDYDTRYVTILVPGDAGHNGAPFSTTMATASSDCDGLIVQG